MLENFARTGPAKVDHKLFGEAVNLFRNPELAEQELLEAKLAASLQPTAVGFWFSTLVECDFFTQ